MRGVISHRVSKAAAVSTTCCPGRHTPKNSRYFADLKGAVGAFLHDSLGKVVLLGVVKNYAGQTTANPEISLAVAEQTIGNLQNGRPEFNGRWP